ncbi:hypothetical protein BO71DRAFT_403337 [Aspergillus ellipticus CBS 707.79]|uniref:HNH nuclease domain-containing protein n=1 Tax=Aspergillus ellipticus CBS 707.79 TaxID=1448320 RepID=A0A319CV11_9EURO|nr:hypothetical protein BO71DRAFT_403337 [Aspergillus ellipticus CBS 707.79]
MSTPAAPSLYSQEYLNLPSEERTKLLQRLKIILQKEYDHTTVPRFEWALLLLCDISKLESIVMLLEEGTITPGHFDALMDQAQKVIWEWTQSCRKDNNTLSSKTSVKSQSALTRDSVLPESARRRDQAKCVITKAWPINVCHIYPFSLLNANRSTAEYPTHYIWRTLINWWPAEKVNRWKEKIFNESGNPCDSLQNMITLSPCLHAMWNRGVFALRPVSRPAPDGRILTVEFLWIPPTGPLSSYLDRVDILTPPPPIIMKQSKTWLTTTTEFPIGATYMWEEDDENVRRVRTGDLISITTPDPEKYPLPSYDLLEMQFILQRLVRMSAAAGEIDQFTSSNDSGSERDANVTTWLESVSPEGCKSSLDTKGSLEPVSTPYDPTDTEWEGAYMEAHSHGHGSAYLC